MKTTIRVLFIGDIIGTLGRMMLQKYLQSLQQKFSIDMTIVNGENSYNNGRGITSRIVHSLRHMGVDVITTGNHVWDQNDIHEYMKQNTHIIRPANFPSECPGVGVMTFNCQGKEVAVVNIQGRVFMKETLDCPFKIMDTILSYLKHKTNIIVVDFHAEATAEKICLGYYLDGRVSCVVGTHTHVPTADERILPKGTGYITDAGMVGSLNSSIGMKAAQMIERFKTQMPNRFVVDTEPPVILTGIWVEIDIETGKTIHIERIKVIDEVLRTDEI